VFTLSHAIRHLSFTGCALTRRFSPACGRLAPEGLRDAQARVQRFSVLFSRRLKFQLTTEKHGKTGRFKGQTGSGDRPCQRALLRFKHRRLDRTGTQPQLQWIAVEHRNCGSRLQSTAIGPLRGIDLQRRCGSSKAPAEPHTPTPASKPLARCAQADSLQFFG
jgi:hypothetical protein